MENSAGKKANTIALNSFFWEDLPGMARKNCPGSLSRILGNGSYMSGIFKNSYLIPPLLFFIGLMIGANHFGFEKPPFADSMTIRLLIIMLFLCIWGASFGCWFLLGFALGDMFIFSYQSFTHGGYYIEANSLFSQCLTYFTHYFLPKLILLALLYSLLVLMPLAANALRVKIAGRANLKTIDKALLHLILYAALCGLLTYSWTKSVPSLIAPVYNWIYPVGSGVHCPPPMSQAIFIDNMLLVWVSVVLGGARFYLEYIFSKPHPTTPETQAFPISFSPKAAISAGSILQLLFSTAFSVFMLSGLMLKGSDDNFISEAWQLAWPALGIVLFINIIRKLIQEKGQNWISLLQRVPFFVRLVIGLAASYYISKLLIHSSISSTDNLVRSNYMHDMMHAVFASLLVMYILLPDLGSTTSAKSPAASRKAIAPVLRLWLLVAVLFTSTAVVAGTFCVIDPNVHGDDPGGEIPKTTTGMALTLALAATGMLKLSKNGAADITITVDEAHQSANAEALASGGTGPYSYEWKNNKTGEITRGATIGNLKAGEEYTVTVTDADNRTVSGTATVVDDKGIPRSDTGADDGSSL